jgi:hypothetical protein
VVTMKNVVFWDVTPRGSCKNCCSVHWLLVMANVLSSPSFVTLLMEVLHFSETSILTRATWHNIPEDGTQHSIYSTVSRSMYQLLPKILVQYNLDSCEEAKNVEELNTK